LPGVAKIAPHTLQTFLAAPDRPEGTLTYHELQGFLFAVSSAPELVRPSEWLPEIFDQKGGCYASEDEAQTILTAMMALYNTINAGVRAGAPTLPADCRMRREALKNLEEDAPVSLWSRGFLQGHDWLADCWEPYIPEDLEEQYAPLLLTLTFFASRQLAEAYCAETEHHNLPALARTIKRVFSEALVEYAHFGRSIEQAIREAAAAPVRDPRRRVGRNDPCPCGSGSKYKRCCGASV
jgi:uncharacterized protein